MALETHNDLISASQALKEWFISQDLQPHEAVIVIQHFMALMMIDNAKNGGTPIFDKIKTHVESIMGFIELDLSR